MGRDRYCRACNKPVIDFTQWSNGAVRAWYAANPDSCGQFRVEQVDPGLVPLDALGHAVRRGTLALLAATAIQAASAQRNPGVPPPTEQVAGGPVKPHVEIDPRTGREAVLEQRADGPVCPVDEAPARKPAMRLYLSKRFPFVHRRPRYVRGKRVIGCPSF